MYFSIRCRKTQSKSLVISYFICLVKKYELLSPHSNFLQKDFPCCSLMKKIANRILFSHHNIGNSYFMYYPLIFWLCSTVLYLQILHHKKFFGQNIFGRGNEKCLFFGKYVKLLQVVVHNVSALCNCINDVLYVARIKKTLIT